MCGIAGFVGPKEFIPKLSKIKEVTSLLKQKQIKHSEPKFLFSVVNIAILEELYA